VGLGVLAACGSAATSSTPTATVAQVLAGHQLLAPIAAEELLRTPPQGLVIIDVRTPDEFAAGHIAGAIDIDLNGATFADDVAKLDPNVPYFVYCHSGNRSAQAVAYMLQAGIGSIYELQGGIGAWQSAGAPIV